MSLPSVVARATRARHCLAILQIPMAVQVRDEAAAFGMASTLTEWTEAVDTPVEYVLASVCGLLTLCGLVTCSYEIVRLGLKRGLIPWALSCTALLLFLGGSAYFLVIDVFYLAAPSPPAAPPSPPALPPAAPFTDEASGDSDSDYAPPSPPPLAPPPARPPWFQEGIGYLTGRRAMVTTALLVIGLVMLLVSCWLTCRYVRRST